jgi:guanine deaminase
VSFISITTIIEGSTITSTGPETISFLPHQLICIDNSGYISRIIDQTDPDYSSTRNAAKRQNQLISLNEDDFLLPGFIDLHVHAPQWPNAGLALDKPLNEWLNDYTFPLEAKYKEVAFAKKVYNHLIQELVDNGTTSALYFGTIHNEANLELAKACIRHQQRGFIGQVTMDNPDQTPSYYRDASAKQAISHAETFIQQVIDLNRTADLKQTPVITPRFVPSCTPESLAGLGALAQKYDLPIQSHCSESDWENSYALTHYHKRDAEVLDQFGLLTDRAIMAHGTLLNQSDLDLFKERGVAIAHCPISNAYFGNAVLPVAKILAQQNKIGLGTDISGGYSPSLYRNIDQAIVSSRMLHDGVDQALPPAKRGTSINAITAKNGFYLATVGGAQSLHLKTGQIKVGYLADLQVVKAPYPTFTDQTPDDIFEKLIYHTTKNNIKQVFVQGKLAKEGHYETQR